MSNIKAYLKNARQALNEKDDAQCISQCQSALELDNKSYTAYVFLGLAHTNRKEFDAAETNYKIAIELDQSNLLAWQGVLSLHEKSGQVLRFLDDASRIAAIYLQQNDLTKCLSTILKAVEHARSNGNRKEKAQALRLILPVSPFYLPLQDDLPSPAETYVELAKLIEDDEANDISSAIAKGRARLGVKLSDLTADVRREVFKKSPLEQIYSEIINWSHEEAVRREAEENLLSRIVERLKVSESNDKPEILNSAITIARGMTIVKVSSLLAWNITLNWPDTPLSQLDLGMIYSYSKLFPGKRLSQALQLYIHCEAAPFSTEDLSRFETISTSSGEKPERHSVPEITEVINATSDALEESSEDPLLCLQILTRLFWTQRDWTSTIDYAELALDYMAKLGRELAATHSASRSEIEFWLATALTYHRSPRFHERASELYDHAIANGIDDIDWQARIGKGTLSRLNRDFVNARKFLNEVLERKPNDAIARLEFALCLTAESDYDQAISILSNLRDDTTLGLNANLMALVHYNLAQCYRASDVSSGQVYAAYIQSLKYDANYAPTYTALGIYYADEVSDERRAAKCFQRALELSSSEFTAAERLASSFAEDSDWELVQIIAERVIHGNEQLQISWPYRAVGFVHLNTGQHSQAVAAFQASLRISSTDVNAWIGLGESYLALGRFQAAEKAFTRASALDQDNWFAQYLSSTVLSALGEHERACETLENLLQHDPSSFSLRTSTSLAYLAWTDALLSADWLSKAIDLCQKVIKLCISTLQMTNPPHSTYHLIGKAARTISTSFMTISQPAKLDESLEKSLQCELADELLPKTEDEMTERSRYAIVSVKALLKYLTEQASNDEEEAATWYEVGHSLSIAAQMAATNHEEWRRAAIKAFQCATQLRPSDDLYWSALGTSTMQDDLEFSQHCLIKAINLNSKSATHWTNLAFFHLKTDHLEAANQAFTSAQQLDPAAPLAWLGQAILAHTMGESDHDLFAHALRLGSPSTYPLLTSKFVDSLFSKSGDKNVIGDDELQNGLWALTAASKCPKSAELDLILKHQKALLLEHGSDAHLSREDLTLLVDTLEQSYEVDEADVTLKQYCDAKAGLARLMLRQDDFEAALETATSVIELEPADNQQSVWSCKFVVGVAQFYLGDHEESVSVLQELFEEMEQDSDILAVLIQVLVSSEDPSNALIALELLDSQPALTSTLKLLYAGLVATAKTPSEAQAKRAQALLSEIFTDNRDASTERARACIERLLSSGDATSSLLSQLHLSPISPEAWLSLGNRQQDRAQADKRQIWEMARAATQTTNVDVRMLRDVYLASPDMTDRLVGLHLSPDVLY